MRHLILSDLHWNNPASRARRLLPLFRRYLDEVDQVVLNGDTLDNCFELNAKVLRAKEEVSHALEARNGPPLFLTGNNDPAISDQHMLYIEEAGLLVTHGDIIVEKAPTWTRFQRDVRREYLADVATKGDNPSFEERAVTLRDVQRRRLRQLCKDDVEPKSYEYLLGLIGYPWQLPTKLSYVMRAPRLLVEEALAHLNRPVRHIVSGHTHWAGRWIINGVTVTNTGSPMPLSRMSGVIVDGETIRMVSGKR